MSDLTISKIDSDKVSEFVFSPSGLRTYYWHIANLQEDPTSYYETDEEFDTPEAARNCGLEELEKYGEGILQIWWKQNEDEGNSEGGVVMEFKAQRKGPVSVEQTDPDEDIC